MRQCLQNITGWAELWAWAHSLSSVAFFLELKEEKVVFYFPLNVTYFDLVLQSRFKTKLSLRSNVDRLTDKMTTVTLWRMHAESELENYC